MNSNTDSAVPVLVAEQVCKRYEQGSQHIEVLQGASLTVRQGQRLAVVGRSGSGKSTLMHVLAGLDDPDDGTVIVAGIDMKPLSADAKASLRAHHMGFVYQNHHLLAEFSALENVAMPLRLAGHRRAEAMERAMEILQQVGLADRAEHIPAQLSGGERQRVAVARAVVNHPSVVLADEPTGNLDKANAQQVMNLIETLSEKNNVAFIIVTHDTDLLDQFHTTMLLENGSLTAMDTAT